MSDEFKEPLAGAFTRVLEEVAMIFADQVDAAELEAPSGSCLAINVGFGGSGTGNMRLMTTADMAREVAAGALGLDADETSDEDAIDALKELLNVALGQLLTDLAGTEAIFDLTAPSAEVGLESDSWDALKLEEGAVGMLSDEHPVLLSLTVSSGPFGSAGQ
ncbi:chemotaxis protein CheX [Engelhardtia mirabilis]|uniref:Chemotaxis phosphatase CheX-like domain-containing protein n=1 Tax=Engelhardtia mirabilis TaxID=2528011 RepID=A0A518BSC5_9BACT|nr:hypothetical protein Pla133_49960 [Planctomycetes bacterium Pla133]QDV04199.1 hypothetical protein Pla86_49940 [Planctomycetes bacterium Pla86]